MQTDRGGGSGGGGGGLTGFRDSGMGKYSENEEEEYPGGQRGREGLT